METAITGDAAPAKKVLNNAIISLTDASIYQTDTLVLSQVNITINKGELVYLVGRTGTGKSSLLKTLYGHLPFKKGEGNVAGFDLSLLDWRTVPYLRRKLGIIFQDFQLLMDRNVEENLRFVLEATEWQDEVEMNERVNNVLVNVGIMHKRYAMPYQLSGGEQQRVVIARALLNDPALILADEPTGNLDPKTSEDIIGLFHQISRETDTAVLIGTHDFYTIKKFPSRMLTCADGKVLEGNHLIMDA